MAAALGIALLVASVLTCAAAGTGAPAARRADASENEAGQTRGRRVYNTRCYFCHGYSGDARTVASTFLDPPPRNFSALAPADLPRDVMLAAVRDGRAGTAMQGFAGLLDEADIRAVVDYVREAFMGRKARPARYHSRANGWTGASESSPAAPFVSGALTPGAPWEALTDVQRSGMRLFDSACVVCHARGDAGADASPWRPEALSNDHAFDPQGGVEHDDDYSDPPFGLHDRAPALRSPTESVLRGEALYQANCAFCHAADGSGRNWIGAFLVPAPPDFTGDGSAPRASAADLHRIVRRGVPGTSMPAWGSVLSDADVGDVVAYLRAAFPAFRQQP